MALADTLKSLNEFDLADLDFENIGSWPPVVKVVTAALLFMLVMTFGYYYHVQGLQIGLANAEQLEITLKRDFEKKAFEAANLQAYERQMVEMEESFGALVSQLPSDTEVPGLLEDITNKGELNGLTINTIDLLEERPQEFYVELPIQINAVGSYHDLGAFVSGMAGLPRIVTLHDFEIVAEGNATNMLKMNILARTYRYRDGDNDG